MAHGTCTVIENGKLCGRRIKGRGMCSKHYDRWRAHGDPLVILTNEGKPASERFWEKVDRDGPIPAFAPHLGPCWVWTGALSGGYGFFCNENGKSVHASRWSYEDAHGVLPTALMPDHLCRVTACVKAIANEQGPAHLEAVTNAENVRRGKLGLLRESPSHCPHGHPFTEENTWRDSHGWRQCRICKRRRFREWELAQRPKRNSG